MYVTGTSLGIKPRSPSLSDYAPLHYLLVQNEILKYEKQIFFSINLYTKIPDYIQIYYISRKKSTSIFHMHICTSFSNDNQILVDTPR